jgi:hypothetical protein
MTAYSASSDPGTPRDVSISMGRVNVLALPVCLGILIAGGTPFVLAHGWPAVGQSARQFLNPLVAIPVLICGIILHELLHGAAWAFYGGKSLDAIRFGVNWRALTPYTHCPELLDAGAYRLGAGAPGVLLGIVPIAISVLIGPSWLFIAGLVFTLAASGDFIILWVLRDVPPQLMVQDHPSRAGCIVYESTINKEHTV